jgi:hypothetical protein
VVSRPSFKALNEGICLRQVIGNDVGRLRSTIWFRGDWYGYFQSSPVRRTLRITLFIGKSALSCRDSLRFGVAGDGDLKKRGRWRRVITRLWL